MRRTLLLLAKAAISILLLYFSLRWVNVSVLADRFKRFEPGWIGVALFLLTAQIALLAARWRKIAAACGVSLAYPPALQLSFIATFFNQVLPSTVGGDGANMVSWTQGRRLGACDLLRTARPDCRRVRAGSYCHWLPALDVRARP